MARHDDFGLLLRALLLAVVVVGCSGDVSQPFDSALTVDAGRPILDGFRVPHGSRLIGRVFRGHEKLSLSWSADLIVTGDAEQVLNDIAVQADRAGVPFRSDNVVCSDDPGFSTCIGTGLPDDPSDPRAVIVTSVQGDVEGTPANHVRLEYYRASAPIATDAPRLPAVTRPFTVRHHDVSWPSELAPEDMLGSGALRIRLPHAGVLAAAPMPDPIASYTAVIHIGRALEDSVRDYWPILRRFVSGSQNLRRTDSPDTSWVRVEGQQPGEGVGINAAFERGVADTTWLRLGVYAG